MIQLIEVHGIDPYVVATEIGLSE
jgi:transposase